MSQASPLLCIYVGWGICPQLIGPAMAANFRIWTEHKLIPKHQHADRLQMTRRQGRSWWAGARGLGAFSLCLLCPLPCMLLQRHLRSKQNRHSTGEQSGGRVHQTLWRSSELCFLGGCAQIQGPAATLGRESVGFSVCPVKRPVLSQDLTGGEDSGGRRSGHHLTARRRGK